MTKERWAQIGITIQFLVAVRTLGEFFRLKHVHGTNFSIALAALYVGGALIAALLLLGRSDVLLLPTLCAVRLDRSSDHTNSVGIQNCRDRLNMISSEGEPLSDTSSLIGNEGDVRLMTVVIRR